MKARKIAWLLVWLALILIYIMDGSYEMGIVLIIYTLICVLNGIFCMISGRQLRAEIYMPYGAEKGSAVAMHMVIHNDSAIPVLRGEARIIWENTLTGEKGEFLCPFCAMSRKSARTDFTVETGLCGQITAQIKDIRIFDMFRIYAKGRLAEASGKTLIFPEGGMQIADIEQKDAYDMESFRYSEEKKGDDSSEAFDIREYTAGDNIRKIHWKLTGKLGDIMVKESSYPVFNSVMLLLETGYETEETPDPEKMDAAAEVFFSAAQKLLEAETPFEVGIYDYARERFFSERVEDADSLWNIMQEVLSAGRAQSSHSAYYQYLANAGGRRFAQYIYVAADGSYSDVDNMAESENITVIRQTAGR